MLRCSAIIVTHNSAEAIGTCLEALAQEGCEIVVVDNASKDATVRRVEEFVPWHEVRLLANRDNLGFAAAVNQGAQAATGDVLLVLNPDATAEPGAVNALLRCMEATHSSAAGARCWGGTANPRGASPLGRFPP